jgi:hypothetical protein
MATFIEIPEPCVRVSPISDYDNLGTVQSVEHGEAMRQAHLTVRLWYVTCASGARAQPYGANRIHTAGEWRSSSTHTTLKDDLPFTVCGESNKTTGVSTATRRVK